VRRKTTRAAVIVGCTLALMLPGCTSGGDSPVPPGSDESADQAAAELAAAIVAKDVSGLEFVGATPAEASEQLATLLKGMGPLKPAVEVAAVDERSDDATAGLTYTWTFPGVSETWSYGTEARLVEEGGAWKTDWEATIVQPELAAGSRLTQRRLAAERGEVLGQDGEALMEMRPVVRYGIDKANLADKAEAKSARRLARLLDVDAGDFAAQVKAAGPEAFVEAITLRAADPARPDNRTVFAIPGALPIEDEQMLAPTRDFARPIVGIVGEATKEIVEESDGAVVAGDQVGLSGLQHRYDEQLRGVPGVEVRIVTDTSATPSPSPSPSPTPSPAASASPSPTAAAERTVFLAKPTPGADLELTLGLQQQKVAERVLARVRPASALVAIRPSTGEVLAAASGPGSDGLSTATVGQYAPGSTFKIATSLALLRAGLTPSSRVSCPATTTVDGRRFKNYSDYPASAQGSISLRTAVAQSCNTAFIGQRGKLKEGDLAGAAASLGLGKDYDVGYPSFFGSVPQEDSATERAAAMIGQGRVQASPLAMASVIASVAAGKTVLPELVAGTVAEPSAAPLTATEARDLRELLRAVVLEGSGRTLRSLAPPAVLAKTGTAEYGTARPPKTHAWMVAAQGDLAVAVFVANGDSGSATAGPLLKRFLSAMR
jgi:cell division protein FtsI/penicillin-binding protein 2